MIVDQAEQKGTGRWTCQDALELGVPLTGITEAVFARSLSSALRDQREAASDVLAGPKPGGLPESLVDDIRKALYASKVVAYAQGFEQMAAAARTYEWDLNMGELAKIWRGGCIIRARFLNRITDSYGEQPDLVNLLVAPYFGDAVADAQDAWRKVIVAAVEHGVAGAGVLVLARVLRRLPPRARAGEPDPGPARLLRRAHVPPRRQGRLVPHPLVAGRL